MMGISMLNRIETFHSKNLMHRDIKPENFVIGVGEHSNVVHLIDFGLARLYKNMQGLHLAMKEGYGLIGTARYASINAHIGRELSRRDDLESIGYTLIYFLKGKLPWQDVKGSNRKEKYKKIKEMKLNLSVEKLCEGIPSCFSVYLNYVRSLNFAEAPSYKHLRKLFEDTLRDFNMKVDYEFDWVVKNRNERGHYIEQENEAGSDPNEREGDVGAQNGHGGQHNSPGKNLHNLKTVSGGVFIVSEEGKNTDEK